MASASVTQAWIDSIDAVYRLFEDETLRSQYPDLARKVEDGVRLCEAVVEELGLEKCALSFNGGKDCTVIVHILAAVVRRLHQSASSSAAKSSAASSSAEPLVSIPAVYITCPSPFPILESFIRASQSRYNLNLVTVGGDMKAGLLEYFEGGGQPGVPMLQVREGSGEEPQRQRSNGAADSQKTRRDVQAIFIGTRRTDPHGESLEPRKWTDEGWPRVERIHPILDWDYQDVWDFLRCPALGIQEGSSSGSAAIISGEANAITNEEDAKSGYGTAGGGAEGVPYCVLYDQGFTSLGSTFNTFPNPILKKQGQGFNPAWQLRDGTSERAGRGDKKA